MRAPSAAIIRQSVTFFTPTEPQGAPVHGGYSQTWEKAVCNDVRYTLTSGAALSVAGKATSDRIFVAIYSGFPDLKEGESLIVEGVHSGSTPPDTGFYRVTHIDINRSGDGSIHNIGVSGA